VDQGKSPRVDLLIVSHHTAAEALSLLAQVEAEDPARAIRLFILDNGSGIEEEARLRSLDGRATVLVSTVNLGFARAVNRLASLGRAPWVLLMNPDLEPVPGIFEQMILSLPDDPRVGIRGGISLGDGPRTHGAFPHLFEPVSRWMDRLCVRTGTGDEDGARPGAPFPADWVSGCFMLVRRELLESLGGFDEGYFMQYEDVDFCYRAAQRGFSAEVDGSLCFRHRGHLSYERSGRPLTGDLRASKARFLTRSQGPLAGWAYRSISRLFEAVRGIASGRPDSPR